MRHENAWPTSIHHYVPTIYKLSQLSRMPTMYCNTPCIEELRVCTGLPEIVLPPKNETDKNITLLPTPNKATGNNCNAFELQEIDEWYNVYDLTFVKSIQDAWNGDAKLLAVIIVLFSGIWPYLKVSQNLKRQKNNRHAIIHLSFNIVLSNLTLQQHPQEFDIGHHLVFTHKRGETKRYIIVVIAAIQIHISRRLCRDWSLGWRSTSTRRRGHRGHHARRTSLWHHCLPPCDGMGVFAD